MKKIFSLFSMTLMSVIALAQQGPMSFAGPSKFGIAAMNAWQENASDTLVFEMTSMTEANITFPSLTYTAMAMTIPSFIIQGLTFEYDMATHNATFPEQTFTTSVSLDGEVKTVTGKSFSATYDHASRSFKLNADFSYGRMPVTVTYTIDAKYITPATAHTVIETVSSEPQPAYDLQGCRQSNTRTGQIMVVGGKKCVVL